MSKKILFLFSPTSFLLYISNNFLLLPPFFFSFLFYLLSLTEFCPHSHLLGLLLSSLPQMAEWPSPFYFFHLFFFSSFQSLHISHWPNGLCLFLFFCLQRVQHTLAHFSLREVRLFTSQGRQEWHAH